MDTLKIILFDEDKLTQTIMESYLKELTFECSLEKYNEFNPAIINDFDCFKVVIVNINNSNSDLIEQIQALTRNKQNKFIIISSINSTDLQVKTLRAGCTDFLIKPIVKSDFIYSIQSIYNKKYRTSNNKANHMVYTAVSFNEFSGKTFFLTNLAQALSSYDKTLLIDCNIPNNVSAFIKNSSLNNSDILPDIKQYKNSNLFLYHNINFSEINFSELKKFFNYILIDYNKILDNKSLLQKNINRIFIISLPENTNIIEQQNKFEYIISLNINTSLVINRYNNRYISLIENFQK